MTTHRPATRPALRDLTAFRRSLEGSAVLPGDLDYDDLRSAWNLTVVQRPAVIVAAASTSDVVRAIEFARDHELGVAIQSTGHGIVQPADDCLLIVTSGMDQVVIDATNATAWVGAGATWGDVLEPAQDIGLAPLLGSAPHVGAVGYVLGGGLGWLARKYGLAADRVRYLEIVTADGSILRTGPTEHPDLFWALRGGGMGNLGVVTGMEIELVPVTTVYAGNLLYPAEAAEDVMRRYREWIEILPDEMTSAVALMNYPDLDAVPAPLRGRSFAIVRGCFCGPTEAGVELMEFWRRWQAPAVDFFGEMPFRDVALISSDPIDPVPGHSDTEWLRDLDDAVIDTLVHHVLTSDPDTALTFAEVRHVGGAVAAHGSPPAAYGTRNEELLLHVVGMTPTPQIGRRLVAHVLDLRRVLGDHVAGSAYLNFLDGAAKLGRAESAFSPDAWSRLRDVKASVDPRNLFRFGIDLTREPARPVEAGGASHVAASGGGAQSPLWWITVAVGAAAGMMIGFIVGVIVLRIAVALSGQADGWEDLTSIAASMFTFAPVGALVGGVLAARRKVAPRWAAAGPRRRGGAWTAIALGCIAAVTGSVLTSDPITWVGTGVLLLPVAGAVGFGIGAASERLQRRAAR